MRTVFAQVLYDFIFRFHFGKDLQHMLADRLLTERRGHRLPREIKQAELEYHQHETGVVELYEDVIKALERKHRAEMEMMVHMLQGKDASQTRANVRKMTNGKNVSLYHIYHVHHHIHHFHHHIHHFHHIIHRFHHHIHHFDHIIQNTFTIFINRTICMFL